jgi:hypothetical protein
VSEAGASGRGRLLPGREICPLLGGEVEPVGGGVPAAESPAWEAIVKPRARGVRDGMQTVAGKLLFFRVRDLSPL